jgi:hypothetical protein
MKRNNTGKITSPNSDYIKKAALTTITFLLLSVSVKADYTQSSVVRFMSNSGWSKKYVAEVTFMSGTELNRATYSFEYSGLAIYAVIVGYQKHPSIINLTESFSYSCFYEVHKGCIVSATKPYKGKDQYGNTWEICVTYNC